VQLFAILGVKTVSKLQIYPKLSQSAIFAPKLNGDKFVISALAGNQLKWDRNQRHFWRTMLFDIVKT